MSNARHLTAAAMVTMLLPTFAHAVDAPVHLLPATPAQTAPVQTAPAQAPLAPATPQAQTAPQPPAVPPQAAPAQVVQTQAAGPAREPGWIAYVSSRADGQDMRNPAIPRWNPQLQQETTDVFARYVSVDGGRISYTEPLAHLHLGAGNIHLPVGVNHKGLWTMPGSGSYRFAVRTTPNKAGLGETCAWHGTVAGIEAFRGVLSYDGGASNPPIEGGPPLALGGGEVPITFWKSCAATNNGSFDAVLDRLHWEGFADKNATVPATPADTLGMAFELLYSKDGAPWASVTGVQHDTKDNPGSLALTAASGASPFSDPTKFGSGWVVEGWQPKAEVHERKGNNRGAVWLGEDDRYPVEFTLPFSMTARSSWSSMAQVQAKVGEAKPYIYLAKTNAAVAESGETSYAMLFRRNNPAANWPLRCGARLTVGEQEVFGPQGTVDETLGNGIGLIVGTANYQATGGYPATLRWGCARNVTTNSNSITVGGTKYQSQEGALNLVGDGRFAAGETGVTATMMVRGPHDEAFHTARPEEFFVQLK